MPRGFGSILIVITIVTLAMQHVRAEWKPEYAQSSPEVQAWYHNAELTPAARERLHYQKCCDHADVVKTRFEVDRSSGRDVWTYEDTLGHMKVIPADIIHWGVSAPGGQPTLFVYAGTETCFFPGDSGI